MDLVPPDQSRDSMPVHTSWKKRLSPWNFSQMQKTPRTQLTPQPPHYPFVHLSQLFACAPRQQHRTAGSVRFISTTLDGAPIPLRCPWCSSPQKAWAHPLHRSAQTPRQAPQVVVLFVQHVWVLHCESTSCFSLLPLLFFPWFEVVCFPEQPACRGKAPVCHHWHVASPQCRWDAGINSTSLHSWWSAAMQGLSLGLIHSNAVKIQPVSPRSFSMERNHRSFSQLPDSAPMQVCSKRLSECVGALAGEETRSHKQAAYWAYRPWKTSSVSAEWDGMGLKLMIIVLVKVSEYLCSMTPSHQPVWADELDLFVLSIKKNFLHYYWKNRIMDLLGFNTRR